MARAGRWVRDEVHGQVPEEPTSQAAGPEYFSLDVEDVPAAGMRPRVLAEPRPQERVTRDTMEHIVDFVCLDAPVPQTMEQLLDVLQFLDALTTDPEQVIEVPKILLEGVSMRMVVREPQLVEQVVEQLVEVPTLVSPSLPADAKKEDTIVAMASDAAGRTWFQVSGPRGHCWWWLSGSRHTQWDHPKGYTARPGRYRNTGQG